MGELTVLRNVREEEQEEAAREDKEEEDEGEGTRRGGKLRGVEERVDMGVAVLARVRLATPSSCSRRCWRSRCCCVMNARIGAIFSLLLSSRLLMASDAKTHPPRRARWSSSSSSSLSCESSSPENVDLTHEEEEANDRRAEWLLLAEDDVDQDGARRRVTRVLLPLLTPELVDCMSNGRGDEQVRG